MLNLFGEFIGDVVCVGHRGGAVFDESGPVSCSVVEKETTIFYNDRRHLTD